MKIWLYLCLLLSVGKASVAASFQPLDRPMFQQHAAKSTTRLFSSSDNKKDPEEQMKHFGTLQICGPDRKGIVAAFAQTLYGHGCNIVDSEQHADYASNMFFQRISLDTSEMLTDRITLLNGINEVAERLGMNTNLGRFPSDTSNLCF